MDENLKYPSIDAIGSVLRKIGVNPSTRHNSYDQDPEYTTCKIEELEQYLNLYENDGTSIYEKRVLGCYFFECLNEHLQSYKKAHPQQISIFNLLLNDIEIHESEFEYWTDISEPDEENWWPITKEILKWRNT